MESKTCYFDLNGDVYNADTCSPLEDAAERNDISLEVFARGHYPGYRLSDDELLSVKSVGYWDATKAQSWELEWHRNEGIEICFLEAGRLVFGTQDEEYELQSNSLTITRPWQSHHIGMVGHSKLHWLIIDAGVSLPHQEWSWPEWIVLNKRDLDELTNILQRNEQPVWNSDENMRRCFSKIGAVIRNRENERYDTKIKIYINEILSLLLDMFNQQSIILDEQLVSSKRSVELFLGNLSSQLCSPLTVELMAEYCGLGVTQFSKYCFEITNQSPMKYFNELRLHRAHEMLITMPEKKITDIAYECGFSSNQYFTLIFKKRFNLSPDVYRNKSKF